MHHYQQLRSERMLAPPLSARLAPPIFVVIFCEKQCIFTSRSSVLHPIEFVKITGPREDYLCFLTRSFSDLQPVQLLSGSAAADGHVAPAAVIDRQITRQPALGGC
jgi:hypothetical protein